MWLFRPGLTFCFICSLQFSACYWDSSSTDGSEEPDTSQVIARKPNIYIYPESTVEISVKVEFPEGGCVIESEPEYFDGWQVVVNPSGIIDNQYEYLFYECNVPNLFQNKEGWVVNGQDLSVFFVDNLTEFGFSQAEIKDFIDFWIPIIDDNDSYLIYPQYGLDLSSIIELNIYPEPDNCLRLVYVIKKNKNKATNIAEPDIPVFKRQGYFVAEWGVIYE